MKAVATSAPAHTGWQVAIAAPIAGVIEKLLSHNPDIVDIAGQLDLDLAPDKINLQVVTAIAVASGVVLSWVKNSPRLRALLGGTGSKRKESAQRLDVIEATQTQIVALLRQIDPSGAYEKAMGFSDVDEFLTAKKGPTAEDSMLPDSDET